MTAMTAMTAMTRASAVAIIGGLSYPSKMPCPSFNLPAGGRGTCNVGGHLERQPGTTCSVCYAQRDRYTFSVVRRAQERRLSQLLAAHQHGHTAQWISAMVWLIDRGTRSVPYFRWHDSGDLLDAWHLDMLCNVAAALPHVQFWLPTSEYKLARNAVPPPNLRIRVSEPLVGQRVLRSFPYTSAVNVPRAFQCPAHTQGNHCGTCRACWSHTDVVSYSMH